MPKPDQAVDVLTALIEDQGIEISSIDQAHDLLKLVGYVIGQVALLEVASSRAVEPAARVSAAKALLTNSEDPEAVAERLRRSPFSGLTPQQLQDMIQRAKDAGTVRTLLQEIQGEPDGPT